MDFFDQQDRARRNTRYLIILFAVAVLGLILLVNALVTAFIWIGRDYNVYSGGTGLEGYLALISWERFATIGLAVSATVAFVSLIRWLSLAAGGKTVAESMGGRRILRDSEDQYEKRCLNVVEELALAANMPVPALYVLPEERGINAFAAGQTPADAVVAVTRGTLLQLKRDELQGVIGHELSHILNGDMRLGIRLAALLKGITFIGDVGHFLLRAGAYGVGRSSRRNDSSAALPLLGLGLMIVGWLGAVAAGFIKAAISRQKEYLADASAVQFTRDSLGIANALKVIGGFVPGSLVHAARAPEMSHIFFGEVKHRLWQGFATHPPLTTRIERLDKNWDGQFINRPEVRYGTEPLTESTTQTGVGRAALVAAAVAAGASELISVDEENQTDAEFPVDKHVPDAHLTKDATATLTAAIEEPLGATAVALGLVTARDADAEASLAVIREHGLRGQLETVEQLLPVLKNLPAGERFPVIARAMPALKSMSTPQYRQFKSTLVATIRADGRIDLFEWCLFQLLRHYLDPEYLRVEQSRPKHRHLAKVRAPLRQVLSMLAHQGEGSSESAFAAATAELGLEELSLMSIDECSITEFSRGVHELANCFPLLKPRILKAMALAAADDGNISAAERELVIAVAAVMDCPVPDDFALV